MRFRFNINFAGDAKKKYAAVAGALLLVVVLAYVFVGGGNNNAPPAAVQPAVVRTPSTTSTTVYSLVGKGTVAVPVFSGEYTVWEFYSDIGSLKVYVSGTSYTLFGFFESDFFTTSGVFGTPGEPITSVAEWVEGAVSGASLTVSSGVEYFVVGAYTFSVSSPYVFVWWTGEDYTVSLKYGPVTGTIKSPLVWVTFTTSTSSSTSTTKKSGE